MSVLKEGRFCCSEEGKKKLRCKMKMYHSQNHRWTSNPHLMFFYISSESVMVTVWISFWVRCKPVSWTNEEKRAWAEPYRLSHVRLVQGTQQMAIFLKKPARILYVAKQQWVENTMRDEKRQKQKQKPKKKKKKGRKVSRSLSAYYIILTKVIF